MSRVFTVSSIIFGITNLFLSVARLSQWEEVSSLSPDIPCPPPPSSAGPFEVVTKLSSGDARRALTLPRTLSGYRIARSVVRSIKFDEELPLAWLRR
ncbi:MAG TPA: hypothetical protein VH350_13915, partial [Candidatus Sulfotelmatobacter sp.]|nr:hypothetical protein [Candidatus Sulfotelmatobacter sp.]